MNEEELIHIARKKVKDKKGFLAHFGIFVAVITFLLILNMLTSPGFLWFLIVAGGWGIGIVGHYIQVYGFPHPKGKDWESDAFKKELAKLKEQNSTLEDETLDLDEEPMILKEYRKQARDYDEDDFV